MAATVRDQLRNTEIHLERAVQELALAHVDPRQREATLRAGVDELALAVGYLTTAVRCLSDPACHDLEGGDRSNADADA